jgi:hypothetical protein
MIRLGLRFLTWLDQRFPARVVVSRDDYQSLRDTIDWILGETARIEETTTVWENGVISRIETMESSIQAIKEILAKTSSPASEIHRRAAFIASGRMGE